jgi:preprotein translocase subunit SecG
MHIEKRNQKMFNIIVIVVLTAILLTAIGGILLQRQVPPAMGRGIGVRAGNNLMQPESTQTSPTGKLVLNTGIILLLIGFIVSVLLLVRRNLLPHNPS